MRAGWRPGDDTPEPEPCGCKCHGQDDDLIGVVREDS